MSLREIEKRTFTGETFRKLLISPEQDICWSKWVRIEDRIMVPKNELDATRIPDHKQLCGDGMWADADYSDLELLEKLRQSDQSKVDAGEYSVSIEGKRICVGGASGGLFLPVGPEARPITLEAFKTFCPGFEIVEGLDF